MGSAGSFLALWNDLARGREAEYEDWHTREHVPERVALPGFRSGRRYVAPTHPVHRWFTLYDLSDLGALGSAEYRDLLDNPTPLSFAMRPHFRNALRVPCTLLGNEGFGAGGALAVLRLADEAALPVLHDLARQPGTVAARLGRRHDDGVAAGFRLGSPGTGASDAFRAVLLLETQTRQAAEQAFGAAAARFMPPGSAPLEAGGVYDLAFVFPWSETSERAAHRRPHWPP